LVIKDCVTNDDFVLNHPPQRIVSLVPSLTESILDLGLGQALVGISDYCIYPANLLQDLPRLGGPKNPRVADIIALKPDLVLVNQEENTPQSVRKLKQAGIKVWISFPRTIRASMLVLHNLVNLFNSHQAVQRLETLDLAVELLELSRPDLASRRFFCPIWRGVTANEKTWWMTFNQDTYANDLLYWLGGENVFAQRKRRYPLKADLGEAPEITPGNKDTRYPRVSADEIRAANPDLVLLPSEPFSFSEEHRRELSDLFADVEAVKNGKIYLTDGSLITWHGTRLAKAIPQLRPLF
jgi:iron complex transport system substrate-binding protein